MGHLRVTIGHLRVTVGHPRVIVGHLRVTIGHPRVTIGHPRVTIGHLVIFDVSTMPVIKFNSRFKLDTSVFLTRLIVVKVPDVGSLQRSIRSSSSLWTSVNRHVLECLGIVVDSPGEGFSVQFSFEIILKYQ